MIKIRNPKSVLGLMILTILFFVSGIAVYALSGIPFGILFQTSLYTFFSSLALIMAFFSYLCFQSRKRLLSWFGLIPAILAIAVVILSLILTIDYRMLYFQSLSPSPSKTEWIEDVHYLAQQMAVKHPDLYSLVSEEKMAETIEEIEKQIPQMTDPEILMALFKIAALPNDCHTFPFIMFPAYDLHSFPFKTFLFPEGLYIVDAGREHQDLIGARILKIGTTTIEDIYHNYPLLLSAENISSYKERFTYMVLMGEWLVYNGIIENVNKAAFTLEKKDGQPIVLSIPSLKFYPHFIWSGIYPVDNDAPPVLTNSRKDNYQYKLMEDGKTLYIQFNQCENQPGKETMEKFVAGLEQFVQTNPPDKCIVDIRNNDGGSKIWGGLVQFLKNNNTINRPGSLFVLIGRRTFSSAVMFATEVQLQTNAILVGEPTGQGPVFYGGPDLIELPHSRLPFAVSRRLTIAGLPFDHRQAIEPDIEVKYSISDFMNGSDPVLETALIQKPVQHSENILPQLNLKKYTGRYMFNPIEVMDIEMDDNTLHVYVSDYFPNSGMRFESKLYPLSPRAWETKIADVKIEIPAFSNKKPDQVILNWFGKKHFLKKTSPGYLTAFEKISQDQIEAGCEILLKQKQVYTAHYRNLEGILNGLGYQYLRNQKITDALTIFRLNINLFPESYNVYDSYGEALLANDQIDLAIQNYKKSLDLNPENRNAERVLKTLTSN